jgi:hypothetical protein
MVPIFYEYQQKLLYLIPKKKRIPGYIILIIKIPPKPQAMLMYFIQ